MLVHNKSLTSKQYAAWFSLIIVLSLTFIIINIFSKLFYVVFPTFFYLTVHTILEFSSIVVSFSVFIIAWYGNKQAHNKQNTIICLTFLMVVILDFAHTLSYNGMPNFLSPNSVNKASTYWILSRFISAGGLFWASQTSPFDNGKWTSLPFLVTPTLVVTLLLTGLVAYYPHLFPSMFIEGQGQTLIKIFAEYVIISLNLSAIFAFNRYREKDNNSVSLLQVAVLFTVFSELAFTLYFSAYDIFNLLGHILKIIAYYFILQALFVSSLHKPYQELLKAKEQIQKLADNNSFLYHQAREQQQELEQAFSLIGTAISSKISLNQTLQSVLEVFANLLKAKYGLIVLVNSEEHLQIITAKGLIHPPIVVPLEHSLAGKAVKRKKPLWINDLETKPWIFRPQELSNKVSSIVAVPIIQKSIVIGALELYSTQKEAFSFREGQLLFAFGQYMGIVLENDSLSTKIK